jgi:hypothetical protein
LLAAGVGAAIAAVEVELVTSSGVAVPVELLGVVTSVVEFAASCRLWGRGERFPTAPPGLGMTTRWAMARVTVLFGPAPERMAMSIIR